MSHDEMGYPGYPSSDPATIGQLRDLNYRIKKLEAALTAQQKNIETLWKKLGFVESNQKLSQESARRTSLKR